MSSDAKAACVDILEALLTAPPAVAPHDEVTERFPNQRALADLLRRAGARSRGEPRKPAAPTPPATPIPAAPAAPPPSEAVASAPVAAPTPRRRKRKTTQYFAVATAARLDRARTALAVGRPGRTTKSGIVEAALTLALDAFEADRGESPLARRLGVAQADGADRPSRSK